MAKPKKTKNGKWTVRVYDYKDADGKQHYKRITADTKDQCMLLAAQFQTEKGTKKEAPQTITVRKAIDQYIELSQMLSPTTLHAYDRIRAFAFQDIMDRDVDELTDTDMQAAINREARRPSERQGTPLSAKTVKNEWGMVAAALHSVCGKQYQIRLPKPERKNRIYPEPAAVVAAIIGTDLELPALLAMWMSLSMSEIRGLRYSDVHGEEIFVDHVVVDVGSVPTFKETAKTSARIRRLRIPPRILEDIQADPGFCAYRDGGPDGFLIRKSRSQIYGRWQTICRQNGLDLSFHDLRHYHATIGMVLGIPDFLIQQEGGWSTDAVMKKHYFEVVKSAQDDAFQRRSDYMEALIEGL